MLHFFKSGFFRFRQGSNLRPFDFTGLLHRTVKCYYLLSYESNGCGLHFGLLKLKFGWIAVMKTHTFGKSMTKPLFTNGIPSVKSGAQPFSKVDLAQPFPKVESSPSGS